MHTEEEGLAWIYVTHKSAGYIVSPETLAVAPRGYIIRRHLPLAS